MVLNLFNFFKIKKLKIDYEEEIEEKSFKTRKNILNFFNEK
jgi:hypothetical protein